MGFRKGYLEVTRAQLQSPLDGAGGFKSGITRAQGTDVETDLQI